MRRLWAASAAIVVCLALGGIPAVAQEASEGPAGDCRDRAAHHGVRPDERLHEDDRGQRAARER
jgi:hypothetical protein